jgi:hypothetical protein
MKIIIVQLLDITHLKVSDSGILMRYWLSGHYPSSCCYLSFKDWTLAPSLGKKSTQLGPIDRASHYLWTPEPPQGRIYK